MSPDTFTLSEAKAALLAMSAEAVELKNAVGGSITDAVADWLAPQYALAVRERLATGDRRRTFANPAHVRAGLGFAATGGSFCRAAKHRTRTTRLEPGAFEGTHGKNSFGNGQRNRRIKAGFAFAGTRRSPGAGSQRRLSR
jgi:hypothetical protein